MEAIKRALHACEHAPVKQQAVVAARLLVDRLFYAACAVSPLCERTDGLTDWLCWTGWGAGCPSMQWSVLCNGLCSGEVAKESQDCITACAQGCMNADLVQSASVLSLQICQISTMAVSGSRQGCRGATSAVCPLKQSLCGYQITSSAVLYKSGVRVTAEVAVNTMCPPSAFAIRPLCSNQSTCRACQPNRASCNNAETCLTHMINAQQLRPPVCSSLGGGHM